MSFATSKSFFRLCQLNNFRFYPNSRIVEVKDRILPEIVFSQLKATVSGNVSCIVDKDCKNLRVLFRQILKGSSDGYEIIAEVLSTLYCVTGLTLFVTKNKFQMVHIKSTMSVLAFMKFPCQHRNCVGRKVNLL